MKPKFRFDKIEQRIIHDEKLLFTIISYSAISLIFINQSGLQSPILGLLASTIYFMINGIFLGNAFFKKETTFFRLMLGLLSLIMLLAFIGWLAVVIYTLDVIRLILALFIVATLSSLLNKRMRNKHGISQKRIH